MILETKTVKLIINELDNYIIKHQEELERALYKVDGVDRRTKIERKGIVSKILFRKRIFNRLYADEKYRAFEGKLLRKMTVEYFNDPISKKALDRYQASSKDHIDGAALGFQLSSWLNHNWSRIVKDVAKEMKEAA